MLKIFASLRVTLISLVVLIGVSWWSYGAPAGSEAGVEWPLVATLAVLSLNLLAAIAVNRAFRAQLPLLIFHLALLALVILVLASRLTYLQGVTEVASGTAFTGLTSRQAGPFHSGAIDKVDFTSLGFTITYLPGLKRDKTLNRAQVRTEGGLTRAVEFGDQEPLVVNGYRFYTSGNKGFSAILRWVPEQGDEQVGTVNFPGYPLYAAKQTSVWRIGPQEIQLTLNLQELLIDTARKDEFRMPKRHSITADLGWRAVTLEPGQSFRLPAGELSYLGLTTWMGYSVFYDWTMPWLLAACTLAVLALGWHFWSKFSVRPWQAE